MPTNRKYRGRRRTELTDEEAAWLASLGNNSPWAYMATESQKAALWQQHGAAIVAAWIEKHPGTRPGRWWEYSAPEPRQRLGGTGTASHETLCYVPQFRFGVPRYWTDARDVAYFSNTERGRARGFAGVAVDPANPPTFESQATYLKRHKLLLAGEAARLKPEDFEPEPLLAALAPRTIQQKETSP